ncbi:PREDICTED: alpha-tocopherol transfer protein-like [Trachymyrmex septentrionalis]|uniref:alpha-tocopherol transfer protein-like n=1 Tax=Trachymyrmex septentrionalis TaxID=34720 RepID=UPI00084F09F0|nr:PREDICTED: alpha-tocopherol transfer protein-like [Trachymyrmex septentrionalis]
MSELSSVPAKLFHSAIIPYNPQDLLGRGRQAGLLESGVGGDGGGRSPMSEEEGSGVGVQRPVWGGGVPPYGRKKYPEITDEILDSLQKWANDRGLPNIPKEQLALFAHSCYFDIEATRRCMNVYYSLRATTPELFNNRDFSLDSLQQSLKTLEFAILPKPDQNGNWIIVQRFMDPRPSQYIFNDNLKLLFMSYDANLYTNGCSEGCILLVDMAKTRFGHLTRLSINSLRKSIEYVQEGLPMRLKRIYVVNAPWFMDKVIALMRPFMKQELFEMIHIYSGDISGLYPHIPLECLPKDYGGELDCMANFHKEHCMKLDQLRNYFREEEALFRNYSPNNVKTASK